MAGVQSTVFLDTFGAQRPRGVLKTRSARHNIDLCRAKKPNFVVLFGFFDGRGSSSKEKKAKNNLTTH